MKRNTGKWKKSFSYAFLPFFLKFYTHPATATKREQANKKKQTTNNQRNKIKKQNKQKQNKTKQNKAKTKQKLLGQQGFH